MPLLHAEEKVGDAQALDALFVTFNADLAFLESRLLGVCQATGARVTVIADAGVWNPVGRSAKQAGRAYHVGLVHAPQSFHPKVTVLAGPKRAIVAIGSGNLTMGGWQYNSETLTVFTGDTTGVPAAFSDMAAFLAGLSEESSLDRLARAAVLRINEHLQRLIAVSPTIDTGHRILTTLTAALLEQIPKPAEPVTELLLTAPFHDRACAAAEALIDRLAPARLRLAVQPGWTVVEADALARLITRARSGGIDCEVLDDPEHVNEGGRYRHGKLIEWATQTQRWAMTGSPNLSRSALLKATRADGNHEVAVVTPLTQTVGPGYTLFPGGVPLAITNDLTTRVHDSTDSRHGQKGVPVLTGAVKEPNGALLLSLAAPAPCAATVEVSLIEDPPDLWRPLTQIAVGESEHSLNPESSRSAADALGEEDSVHYSWEGAAAAVPPALVQGASRCRLRWTSTTADGAVVPTTGPLVYVSDRAMVLRRPVTETTSRTNNIRGRDLIRGDLEILRLVRRELEILAQDISAARGIALSRDSQPGDPDEHTQDTRGAGDDEVVSWLWIQDQTVQDLGPGLTSFALGLPPLPQHNLAVDLGWWEDPLDDKHAELEGETAADIDADVNAETDSTAPVGEADSSGPDLGPGTQESLDRNDGSDLGPDQRKDPESERQARRAWCRRAVEIAADLPIPSRLLVLRLTLAFWSAGNWDDDDLEPPRLVATLLGLLDGHRLGEELEARVGSLAAVALTMMRDRTDLTTHNESSILWRDTAVRFGHLPITAEAGLVTEFSRLQRAATGFPLSPDTVWTAIEELTAADEFVDVVAELRAVGYDVLRPGPRTLAVYGTFTNPALIASQALGMAEDQEPVGVWAINSQGKWAFAAWSRPDLITAAPLAQGRVRWRHQVLTGLVGPAALHANHLSAAGLPYERRHQPWGEPFPEATALLHRLGIENSSVIPSLDPRNNDT